MGVATPISKEEARLILAAESATKAIRGDSNVFDEATHIRIHLCELKDPPQPLRRIVNVSNEARNAQRSEWGKLEQELTDAMSEFLRSRK
jgi:hypothetical protein